MNGLRILLVDSEQALVRGDGEAAKSAVVFTQQFVGLGSRKTSTVFWCEEFAKLGWCTHVVTTQLSWLSRLARVSRLNSVPPADINRWCKRDHNLLHYVWIPPVHPASTRFERLNRLAEPILRLYIRFLPDDVRCVVRDSDLVIIESGSAILLFDLLKRIAPGTRFVYRASDRLRSIGMHPMLERELQRTASNYDLILVPARRMHRDFPPEANVKFIPQGLDKDAFNIPCKRPFNGRGKHAVLAGDMMFDALALDVLSARFPEITFHIFGRQQLGPLGQRPNVISYGEVPYDTVRSFIIHADVGLALYRYRSDLAYLAESSLKLVQYTYARLPIVAPDFCRGDRAHLMGYVPGNPSSIEQAMLAALCYDRSLIDVSDVHSWREAVETILRLSPEGPPPGAMARGR